MATRATSRSNGKVGLFGATQKEVTSSLSSMTVLPVTSEQEATGVRRVPRVVRDARQAAEAWQVGPGGLCTAEIGRTGHTGWRKKD